MHGDKKEEEEAAHFEIHSVSGKQGRSVMNVLVPTSSGAGGGGGGGGRGLAGGGDAARRGVTDENEDARRSQDASPSMAPPVCMQSSGVRRDITQYFHCKDKTLALLGQCRCRWCGQRVRKSADRMMAHVVTHCSRTADTLQLPAMPTGVSAVEARGGLRPRRGLCDRSNSINIQGRDGQTTQQYDMADGKHTQARLPLSWNKDHDVGLPPSGMRTVSVGTKRAAEENDGETDTSMPKPWAIHSGSTQSGYFVQTTEDMDTLLSPSPSKRRSTKKKVRTAKKSKACRTNQTGSETPMSSRASTSSSARSTQKVVSTPRLLEGLAVACVMENVPPAFLSSEWLRHALSVHVGVDLPFDATQQAMVFFRNVSAHADRKVEDMLGSGARALTLVVTATVAARTGSGDAPSYLSFFATSVDRCGGGQQSVLLATVSVRPGNEWIATIQSKFEYLCRMVGPSVAVHLCLSGFPNFVLHRLPSVVGSHSNKQLQVALIGGCMSMESSWLFQKTMSTMCDPQMVFAHAARLALLVNEVEKASRNGASRRDNMIVISVPRLTVTCTVQSFVVLLRQLLRWKNLLLARWAHTSKEARGDPISNHVGSGDGGRENELQQLLLDTATQKLWDRWEELVAVMTPFSVVEAVVVAQLRTQDNHFDQVGEIKSARECRAPIKGKVDLIPLVTSGLMFALEIWAFQEVLRTTLLSPNGKSNWIMIYVRQVQSRRWDHHLAAVLLDPRVRGAGLSKLGVQAATACVVKISQKLHETEDNPTLQPASSPSNDNVTAALMTQLSWYLDGQGIFGAADAVPNAGPLEYWRNLQKRSEFHDISEVAMLVCSYAPLAPSSFSSLSPLGEIDNEATLTAVGRLKHAMIQSYDTGNQVVARQRDVLRYLVDDSSSPFIASFHAKNSSRLKCERLRNIGNDYRGVDAILHAFEQHKGSGDAYGGAMADFLRRVRGIQAVCEDSSSGADARSLCEFSSEWIDDSVGGYQRLRAALARALA